MAGQRRPRAPRTTLELTSLKVLPGILHRFLFSRPQESPVARYFIGALFGAVCGYGLSQGFSYNLPLSFHQRTIAACLFVALCITGGAFSSTFCCSFLLTIPCLLSAQGRAYMMLLLFSGLASGPISNIQHNMQAISLTLGCNIDLQINHTKVMWKAVMKPFRVVLDDIVESSSGFQQNVSEVKRNFKNLTDELMAQYGYDPMRASLGVTAGETTQDRFAANTMKHCDSVVDMGIKRCKGWFKNKHDECMNTIRVPIINDILCVSLKFDFLCDVMKIMIPWCKEQIPVEGNFGNTYDKLNESIDRLAGEFHAEVGITEEEVVGDTVLKENFTEGLRRELQEIEAVTDRLFQALQFLMSVTFLTIYISAFCYCRQYNRNIQFDNMYITTYFRQIDACRKKAGKSYLLPTRKAERGEFIIPNSISVHSIERKVMTGGLLQVLAIGVVVGILLGADRVLYHMLGIIERHTFTEFNLTSIQDIKIEVHNHSMMARLLRNTIGAFNTSFNMEKETSNIQCLPHPVSMTPEEYVWSTVPLLMLALMCVTQAYSNRLRRVIASFFFPKREKTRVLFLYNLHIHRRRAYAIRLRRRVISCGLQTTWCPGIVRGLERLSGWRFEWCYGCGERQRGAGTRAAVRCPTVGCQGVFCPECWEVLDKLCPLCGPRNEEQQVHESCSDAEGQ